MVVEQLGNDDLVRIAELVTTYADMPLGHQPRPTTLRRRATTTHSRLHAPAVTTQTASRTAMSVTTAQYYYTYAGDDPINNIDPSGMCWTGLCWIKHGVRRFGHELEKPTYAVYIYSRWLNHKSRYTLTPLLVGPEALGLAGDMTGDALEGENPCDEGKPGHVPLINGKWFYGCHNGHIDIP